LPRQKARGAAAKAQLRELVNDELGLVAALVATMFILWGRPIVDPLAAILVATLIAASAIGLFRENASFLLGRSPGPESLASIERLVRSVPDVEDVRDLRVEYVGPDTLHAGMRITVRRGLPIEDAAQVAERVRRAVHEQTESGYCFIQVEAAPEQQPNPSQKASSSLSQ
jgi:cation diffusion facilitator family transporter